MAEGVFVEPTEKVLKALKTAMETLGKEELIKEINVSEMELNRWLNGEEWIPLKTLYEICKINSKYNKPYNTLSNVIEKATVISRGRKEEKTIEEKVEIEEERKEDFEKKLNEERGRIFRFMIIRSTMLLSLMIPLIILGYIIGKGISEFYAGIGMVLGIVIWLLIITTYIILKPIKYR
ncbi:MAG: hypothetical protein QXX09_00395 [Candidatus Methanomethylicia archaeon]